MLTSVGPDAPTTYPYTVGRHSVQVNVTGAPTAVTVALEGSLDGVTWFQFAEHVLTSGEIADQAAMFHVINKPSPRLRPNLTALAGGTEPTVSFIVAGVDR